MTITNAKHWASPPVWVIGAINITKTDNWTVAAGGWAEVRTVWCQGDNVSVCKRKKVPGEDVRDNGRAMSVSLVL